MYEISGRWDRELVATNPQTGQRTVLGSIQAPPPNYEHQYYFTNFVRNLNNLTPKMIMELPRTDARFRPDNRAYEFSDIDLANSEKLRLEELQRSRKRESEGWKPLWFNCKEVGQEWITEFNGEYWKCKEAGRWPERILTLYN